MRIASWVLYRAFIDKEEMGFTFSLHLLRRVYNLFSWLGSHSSSEFVMRLTTLLALLLVRVVPIFRLRSFKSFTELKKKEKSSEDFLV